MVKVVENEFNEKMGYFKITLEDRERMLLTRKQYGEVTDKGNHNHLMFESTSGNFYKPFTIDDDIHFKRV